MPVDLKKFKRRAGAAKTSLRRFEYVGSLVSSEVDAKLDPLSVPFETLRRLDRDPVCYLGERASTGLVIKPDLYHVKHELGDKALVAETYEWLWPLLPKLLPMVARSFVYGAIPIVFTWIQEDLVIRVPGPKGKPRKQTRAGHWHYLKSNELRPDQVVALVNEEDDLVQLEDTVAGERYDSGRARVSVWDQQFGEWCGQGARRRAFSWAVKGEIFELLKARYLERTVHAPLVVYAPSEDMPRAEGDSEDISVGDFVAEQIEELRGGGVLSLPGERWKNGEGDRQFEVVPLELPERDQVFDRALNRFDGQKLASYLVPSAMPMLEDGLGSGASRVAKELFSLFVEGLVGHAVGFLQEIVDVVHAQNHDPRKVPAPEVGANQIPDKVQKLYLEVLRSVSASAQLEERVDVDGLLDHLGVPRKEPGDPPASKGDDGRGPQGRPRDMTSAREERREDARTEGGEDDTGGEDPDREGRE